MAKSCKSRFHFGVSPEILLAVMTDPKFEEAHAKEDVGALDVEVKVLEESENRLVYDLALTEYARSATGTDKSRTEVNTSHTEWDLQRGRAEWSYRHVSQGKRVRVWGTLEVQATANGADLLVEQFVEVKIPFVGGQVEKVIIKETEKTYPAYEALIGRFCDARAGA